MTALQLEATRLYRGRRPDYWPFAFAPNARLRLLWDAYRTLWGPLV